jgi:hypothetical protein
MFQLRRRELLLRSVSALFVATMATAGRAAHADASSLDLNELRVQRGDDGSVLLSYDARFDLPEDIEQALSKGIAVVFVAEATVYRRRWYWMDEVLGTATRRWRLAYQPLTRRWRLSFDGLSQFYPSLRQALDVIRRTTQWRVSDPLPDRDDEAYVDFRFQLDTNELPRPLQIGLGDNADWQLKVQRRVNVPAGR